jgi:hypothetical protein
LKRVHDRFFAAQGLPIGHGLPPASVCRSSDNGTGWAASGSASICDLEKQNALVADFIIHCSVWAMSPQLIRTVTLKDLVGILKEWSN